MMMMKRSVLARYMQHLAGVKQQEGGAMLTWNQLQEGINSVNSCAEDQHQRTTHTHHADAPGDFCLPVFTCVTELQAVGLINEALMRGDVQQLLSALLLPSGGLEDVIPANACRYLMLLTSCRHDKAQVSAQVTGNQRFTEGSSSFCFCPIR